MSKESMAATVPPITLESIERYERNGYVPGHFVTAVLENDLCGAINRADKVNLAALIDTVRYLYNHVTAECWGSPEKVRAWAKKKAEEREKECLTT